MTKGGKFFSGMGGGLTRNQWQVCARICTSGGNLTVAYDNGIVKPKKTMDCGVIRNGKSYD